MWKRLCEPLSGRQLLQTMALLVLGAGVAWGLYQGGHSLWHRWLLERSIPAALSGVRSQRDLVVEAIEAYRKQFGYYPPMFTPSGPNRGVINPLGYELVGVRFNPRRQEFFIPTTKDALSAARVQQYFNAQSFSNCLAYPDWPTNFLVHGNLPTSPLTKDGELFGVGLSYTEFTPEALWDDFEYSPWRYATNPAEHNPGKFDLWVELNVAGKHFTIGNWPEVR